MKQVIPVCLTALASLVLLSSEAAPQIASTHLEPRSVFMDNCAACHQAGGVGIAGVFPALAGNSFVKGDPAAVVQVILAGRNGMPSFRNDLSDEQIAAVVSYIRQSLGNNARPVAPGFVAEIRERTNNPRGQNPSTSN